MHEFHFISALLFVVGLALHTLAQIDAIARAKNNPTNSRVAILKDRWSTILIRSAWCFAIFVLWLQGELVDVLTAVNVTVPDALKGILDLHVGAAIGFMAGYLFDSGLGYIPALKTSLPPDISGD